jgi:hypothetical protein
MKGTKYKAGGGANKNVKYRSVGGGMKSTKGMPMGGAMKGPKGFTKGGAALASEMQANPGMGNMPKSVMSALMGAGTRAQGQTNVLRQPKGMTKGGGMSNKQKDFARGKVRGSMRMKKTKGRSTGGAMSSLGKGIKNIGK